MLRWPGGVPIDSLAGRKRGSLPQNESVDPGPTVAEICLVFLRFAESHDGKNGKPDSELCLFKNAMRLGHSKADMTEHYARASAAKALEVARKFG